MISSEKRLKSYLHKKSDHEVNQDIVRIYGEITRMGQSKTENLTQIIIMILILTLFTHGLANWQELVQWIEGKGFGGNMPSMCWKPCCDNKRS